MADFYGISRDPDEVLTYELIRERLLDFALGWRIWDEWFSQGAWHEPGYEDQALDRLIIQFRDIADAHPFQCPRVFVSHRQDDVVEALRIAWLANQSGFEFWLDILDPNLQAITSSAPQPSRANATLVASLIELALLNSTHVIAALSKNTHGTLWIPYEYGRVKERKLFSRRVAVWLHPNIPSADVPDYRVLGITTQTELDVTQWLRWELKNWCGDTGRCCSGAGNAWDGGQTDQLPE